MLAKIVFYRFMDRGGVEFHKNARKQRGQYSAIFDQTSLVKTIYCIAYREIPLARHRLHARWANHSQANIFPSLASHLRVVCTALTGLVALPSVFVVTGIFFFWQRGKQANISTPGSGTCWCFVLFEESGTRKCTTVPGVEEATESKLVNLSTFSRYAMGKLKYSRNLNTPSHERF